MQEIASKVISGTSIGRDLRNIEEKVAAYPGVKTCKLEIESISGEMLDQQNCRIALDGKATIETSLLLRGSLSVGGEGELDLDNGVLTLKKISIHNDLHGVMTKIAEWLGFAPGHRLPINQAACQIIRDALSKPVN